MTTPPLLYTVYNSEVSIVMTTPLPLLYTMEQFLQI